MRWTEYQTVHPERPSAKREEAEGPAFTSGLPSQEWVPPVSILRLGIALPSTRHPERGRSGDRAEKPAFRFFRRAILILFTIAACSTAFAQAPSRFVVVLDAAHGGDDAGAHLGSQNEKAFTLAFSVRLRSLLAARGFTVVTTRDSDAGVDPDRRADIADHANPQACLTLHATEIGSGVHLFVSSFAPVQDVRFMPWKTAQAAWVLRSTSLAGLVNSALSHASVPVTLGRIAMPGIDSMTCPAVAVEIAPGLGSDAQAADLDNQDYQARVADALAAALVEWRSQPREGRQP